MVKTALKKVLSCVLSVSLLASSVVVTAQALETAASAQQIVYAGEKVSVENGKVTASKTITGTDTENVFDITLKVTTTEELEKLKVSPDAAVVLVMDTSNSMMWDVDGDTTGKDANRRITKAKAAAQEFLKSFVNEAEDAKRMVSLVEFGSNAKTVLGWTNANQNGSLSSGVSSALNGVKNGFKYYDCNEIGSHTHDYSYIDQVNNGGMMSWGDWNTSWGSPTTCSVCGIGYSRANEYHYHCEYPGCTKPQDSNHTHSIEYDGPHGDSHSDGGGTNIEGGLMLARNLLTEGAKEGGAIEGIKSVYVVMLTDGVPTYHVSDKNESTTETSFIKGSRGGGDYATESDYKDVPGIAAGIKNAASLYTISYATSEVSSTVNGMSIKAWLGTFATQNFDATNNEGLTLSFDNIIKIIKNAAKAWITTDPMGDHMVFDTAYNAEHNGIAIDPSSDAVRSFDTKTNQLKWDLKSDATVTSDTVGDVTTYTYTLKYRVMLDTLSGVKGNTAYPTNKKTTLSYMVSDANGNLNPNLKYVDYKVPTVKGLFGDLSFRKTAYHDGTGLTGAVFSLVRSDNKVSRTATSNRGAVSFSNLPNGTYTLTETSAAPGYDKTTAASYTVKVSYGNVSVQGVSGALTVTNKLQQQKTSVNGQKTWVDGDGANRPASITVILKQDGTEIARKTVSQSDRWAYSFTNLDKINLETGADYAYTVDEILPAGYDKAVSGTNIQNTLKQEKIRIEGTKIWVDGGDELSTRPNSVVVELYANGKATGRKVTTNASKNWGYSFTNLDKYDAARNPIVYTVVENNVDSRYTATVGNAGNGYNITNTIKQESVSVSGRKAWIDNGNAYGTRPASVTLALYADGVDTNKRTTASGADHWTYRFNNLNKFSASGAVIKYTVKELNVDGRYTATEGNAQNGYTVTNTIKQQKTSVSVTKNWVVPEGTNKPSVTIYLKNGGNVIDSVTLDGVTDAKETTAWQYTFSNLDMYDLTTGAKIDYTVSEDVISGYNNNGAPDISGNMTSGYVITNTLDQDTVSISGSKTWVDNGNAGNTRPATITIELYRDGGFLKSTSISSTAAGYTFTDLDKYAIDRHVYEYTVKEVAVEGYTTQQDGYNFTNTIEQQKTSVSVNKQWIAPEDRKSAVAISLKRNGVIIGSVTLDGKTDAMETTAWQYTFSGLDKYDLTTGAEYEYTVEEATVLAGFNAPQITGSAAAGYTITNTIAQQYTSVSGTKTWIDPAGTVHSDLTITLMRDGADFKTQILHNGDTSYQFTGLEVYNLTDGHAYEYTVKENTVAGYTSQRNGNNFINTIEQQETSVSVSKQWIAPDEKKVPVTINLKRDGAVIDSVTLDGETDAKETTAWQYTFSNLDKYDLTTGEAYNYTVEEATVLAGFEAPQVTGDAATGYTITNTIAQQYTSVSGTKTWIDPAGTEHGDLTITLMRDGVEFKNDVLRNGDTSYGFDGLEVYDLTDGHAYEYTVKENTVAGYTPQQDGYDFINTIEQQETFVSVSKQWIAPDEKKVPVTINLKRDGVVIDSVTLDGETDAKETTAWQYTFSNLDKYNLTTGEAYNYTVEEETVLAGFEAPQVTGDAVSGYTITNTIAQQYTSVSGTKTWIDPAGTEHGDLTITLVRDTVDCRTVTLHNGETSYRFDNLEVYDLTDGHAYTYTVTESAVEGYTSRQDGNDFINTIEQQETSVSVNKRWIAPDELQSPVTINLKRDGAVIDSVTLDGETDTKETTAWQYKFGNLDKYDLTTGAEYNYTVEEATLLVGFEAPQITGDAVSGYTITNAIAQQYTFVTGTKTWIDPAGTEHGDLTITLMRDAEDYRAVTLHNGETSYSFSGLEVFDPADGHVYEYTVRESAVEGYTSRQDGYDFFNTIEQEAVSVSGSKTWVGAPADEPLPDVTIVLSRDGEELNRTVMTNGTGWTYSFDQLDRYDLNDGHEYSYTVAELPVEGYTAEQNGYDFVNTYEEEEIPDDDPPLAGPSEEPSSQEPEEEIPDNDIPLTGGIAVAGGAVGVFAVSALAVLLITRRKKEEDQ